MSQPVDLSDDKAFVHGFAFDFFAELRARGGLHWQEATDRTPDGEGFWVAGRYQDVVAVLGDASHFGSAGRAAGARGGPAVADAEPAASCMSTADGARHQYLRGLAGQGITAAWLRDYPAIARRRADDALDRILTGDTFDFISDAARELGSHSLFDLMGVPDADRARIIDWTYGSPDGRSGDEGKRAREACFRDLVAERSVNPGTDALGEMIRAQVEGRTGSYLTTPEVLAFIHLVYPVGADACAAAIAGAVKAFSDAPEQYARFLDEADTLDSAVEEILRWTTPSLYARRAACADVELEGCRILAGQKVTAWLASANRDERVFADPDRFDVARGKRPGNAHLAGADEFRFSLSAFSDERRSRWLTIRSPERDTGRHSGARIMRRGIVAT
jgi:cytochrome P450